MSVEWHDVSDAPPRGPLWVYLEHGLIEMGSYGHDGWRSAFNPQVIYDHDAVLAWAVVSYPSIPTRKWVTPESADSVSSYDSDQRLVINGRDESAGQRP